jgi:2-polyprenyl-3-methyl-5-hydroxy-6-metoxy-1,4-benzoquinol methylase
MGSIEEKISSDDRLTTMLEWDHWAGVETPDLSAHLFLNAHERELWERIIPSYIPALGSGDIIEIGSAPGIYAARLANQIGANPWGLEYTPSGARVNRSYFEKLGYSSSNVIEGDFFDDKIVAPLREKFDVVMSNGFIEHFEDPSAVIKRHLELVKPGGLLLITIPNFVGFYSIVGRFIGPNYRNIHNLDVMYLKNFRRAMVHEGVSELVCRHHGMLHLIFDPRPTHGLKKLIFTAILNAEAVLHKVRSFFPSAPEFNSAFFSPNLVYIGRKGSMK